MDLGVGLPSSGPAATVTPVRVETPASHPRCRSQSMKPKWKMEQARERGHPGDTAHGNTGERAWPVGCKGQRSDTPACGDRPFRAITPLRSGGRGAIVSSCGAWPFQLGAGYRYASTLGWRPSAGGGPGTEPSGRACRRVARPKQSRSGALPRPVFARWATAARVEPLG